MSNNTPEALRLARMIEHYNAGVGSQRLVENYQQAADELRRLYFENEKFRASLAEQPESLNWASLNKAADEIVRSKLIWKRFIDGTPLANDIACWMADFALEHTAPQPAKQPLTDEFLRKLHHIDEFGLFCDYDDFEQIARAIEAAHGIKENT